MKKLLLSLMVVTSFSFANCNDPANAKKVVGMLHSHNKTAVQVNYSPDQAQCAAACKANVLALDNTINVILNQEASGTDLCKFAKPGDN